MTLYAHNSPGSWVGRTAPTLREGRGGAKWKVALGSYPGQWLNSSSGPDVVFLSFFFKFCFSFKKIFSWSIVALQCCVSFYCKQSESIKHIQISPLFWISFLFRSPESIEQSSLSSSSSRLCVHAQLLSHVQFSVTPWTVAHQAPLSMEFSRQEYWSRFPFPTIH